MKKILAIVCICLAAFAFVQSVNAAPDGSNGGIKTAPAARFSTTPAGWWDNFDEGLKAAKAANVPALVLFTGSDWCGWCKKLHKEVLATKDFKEKVGKKMVLIYMDVPRNGLPENQVKINQQLMKQYCGPRSGFPTTVIMSGDAKVLGKFSGFRSTDDYIAAALGFAK